MAKELRVSRGSSPVAVYKYKSTKKKKRRSKRLKGFGKMLDRMARANETASAEFRRRHDRDSRKKKDGGVKKLRRNMFKAAKKGRKKMKLKKMMRF